MLPTCRRHGMAVIPWSPLAGGWLSGKWRKGQDAPQSSRAERMPARYDLSDPGNQRKLDAADALAQLAEEAGLTLIQLALAWVINHPAVTSAIIGPRTMEQLESQLGADEVVLDASSWTASTRSCPPGTTLSAADAGYQNPALKPEGALDGARVQPAETGPAGRRRSTSASATASGSTTYSPARIRVRMRITVRMRVGDSSGSEHSTVPSAWSSGLTARSTS